jgi:hypothetical protein
MSVSKHQKLQELLGILTRVCESRRGMTTVLDSDENSFVVDCALPESMCMMLGPGASTAETESRIKLNIMQVYPDTDVTVIDRRYLPEAQQHYTYLRVRLPEDY